MKKRKKARLSQNVLERNVNELSKFTEKTLDKHGLVIIATFFKKKSLTTFV